MPGIATVTYKSISGKPEDSFTNTFAFDDDVTVEATQDGILSDLNEFYNADTGEPGTLWTSVSNMFSDVVDRTLSPVVKFFNLQGHQDGSPHGSPIRTDVIAPPGARVGAISGNLPEECAIVLSIHGSTTNVVEAGAFEQIPTPRRAQAMGAPETHLGQTKPRARRRGRLYIGPLIADTGGLEGSEYHVMGSARSLLVTAAARLMNRPTSTWAVWSRRDATLRPVVGGFVDNAFDTQRSRGRRSSARQVFGVD